MSTETVTNTSGIRGWILETYFLMRQSVSLSIALLGALMIVLGATAVEALHPVMGAIFGIWGVAAILAGLLAYAILWLNKTYRD